jgi:hypothetical protein
LKLRIICKRSADETSSLESTGVQENNAHSTTNETPSPMDAQEKEKKTTAASHSRTSSNRAPVLSRLPPSMTATSDAHPGLSAFHRWHDVETSLYRIYMIGRTDRQVDPPFIPRSERGKCSVELKVVNRIPGQIIDVFWIDFKGVNARRPVLVFSPHFGSSPPPPSDNRS